MAYKMGEKTYKINITAKMKFENAKHIFQDMYNEMCVYHEKKITDYKHYINFIKKKYGISLSTADAKEIIRINTEDGNNVVSQIIFNP